MKVEQRRWTFDKSWQQLTQTDFQKPPQVVFVFGSPDLLRGSGHLEEIKSFYPESHILMCSTAGEILNTDVSDNSLAVSAVLFENTELQFVQSEIHDNDERDSLAIGKELAAKLNRDDVAHVMVFSDGLKINGTSLVQGFVETLPSTTSVTGGLAGDSSNFKETVVGLDVVPTVGKVVAIGFYGTHIRIGYGSFGGWDTFGPERLITKSKDNILYEVDNKNALQLYKEYLGEQAAGLPSTGLLFPMSLTLKNVDGTTVEVVRTLLGVNEADQSMTFAGNMPEGVYARLMKANFDRLVDGAANAASMSIQPLLKEPAEFAILISCVGRKLVLEERTEEETEAVRSRLGEQAAMTGFYSYGEICPAVATEKQCQLHNQTMTITTFREETTDTDRV